MTIKILGSGELLRRGNYGDAFQISRPAECNIVLVLDRSEATIFCPNQILDDDSLWPVDYEHNWGGWHMWEETEYAEEKLHYMHLLKDKESSWVFFGYCDQTYSLPVSLAEEFIFRLEVYLGHAE